jgi:hypothetical protein
MSDRRERIPPFRASPFEIDDDFDARRVEYAWGKWRSQDMMLLARDRQIEENVRMIAGRHWSVWSRLLGRFLDLNDLLSERERLWRQRPVLNHVLDWFILTHARMTENPPIITFQPSTLDSMDRDLAEIQDTIFKSLWNDCGMLDVIDRVAAILIPSGVAHFASRVDAMAGEIIEWKGPAVLTGEFGGEQIRRIVPDAPYDQQGQPLARLTGPGPNDWEATGRAYAEHEGGIVVDAISPLGVRGQWGHDIPWHRKRWHQRRLFLTPEEVYALSGREIEPDVRGDDAHRVGELKRMMFGGGNYGAAEYGLNSMLTQEHDGAEGFCDVLEMWEPPCSTVEGMERTEESPGGRMLIVSRREVLRDGARPAPFKYGSPIRTVDFVRIPGRPSGSSPQESMNAINRLYNRNVGNVLEHGNKAANPIRMVDLTSGIERDSLTNEPGQTVYLNRRMGTTSPPIEYAKSPELGEAVYRSIGMLKEELRDRGYIEGALGHAPGRDPSGELVKELRFNSDRPMGTVARRFVIELARMAEDWNAIIPTIWTQEKMISWAGQDAMLKTVLYAPELFSQGSVNVTPDIESMLPEGRGERRTRARADWLAGAFGDPTSPAAIKHYLEIARFPHDGRAVRPGGVHRIMAERENGLLVSGVPASEIPVFEWHDHTMHLEVLEEFMAGPDYVALTPAVQQECYLHRQEHKLALELAAYQQAQLEGRMLAGAGRVAAGADAAIADIEGEFMPAPPPPPRSASVPAGNPPGGGPIPNSGGTR